MTDKRLFGGVDPSNTGYCCAILDGSSFTIHEGLSITDALLLLTDCERVIVETPRPQYVQPGTTLQVLQTLEMAVALRTALFYGPQVKAFSATAQEVRKEPWGQLTALDLAKPGPGVKADLAMALWVAQVWLPEHGYLAPEIDLLFNERDKKRKKIGPLSNNHKVDALCAAIHCAAIAPEEE